MGYRLIPYTAEWEQASARSNARLHASGAAPFFLPERAAGPQDSPQNDNRAVRREHYLVLDDGDEVRGGCLFQYCQARVDGAAAQVVNVQSPLSEGLFDLRYAGVAPWMIREIVRRHPLAYCVGMGGEQLPFPRLLRALGWRVEPLPFYFRVLAGRLFLANMQLVRKHPRLGPLATAGGVVPFLPDLLLAVAPAWRTAKRDPQRAPQPHHGGRVAWAAIRTRYAFGVERTPDVLDALYPPADPHFLRIQVPGGFGVLRTHQFRGDSYFGNLRVATLVEAMCQPEAVRSLLRAALDGARGTGAGLLITNQSAPELQTGLKSEGWFSYRSNYLTGLSLPLATRIGLRPCYINRGDGDGLLNL